MNDKGKYVGQDKRSYYKFIFLTLFFYYQFQRQLHRILIIRCVGGLIMHEDVICMWIRTQRGGGWTEIYNSKIFISNWNEVDSNPKYIVSRC